MGLEYDQTNDQKATKLCRYCNTEAMQYMYECNRKEMKKRQRTNSTVERADECIFDNNFMCDFRDQIQSSGLVWLFGQR